MCSSDLEAISDYGARACEKMRAQGSRAKGINVYIQTYWYDKKVEHYSNAESYWFELPVDDTSLIIKREKKDFLFKPSGLKPTLFPPNLT